MSENKHPLNWPRAIAHLDMDAFFVNVHLLEHPDDAGLPLAVGGKPESRGVVASASYEARAFGIRSAMPMKTAVRLCPQLKIVGSNWENIRSSSRKVMAMLREIGPIEQVSVDEAFVDLSEQVDPAQIAIALRERVKAELKLPASVGLATSKLVAKVASDFDKPAGCTIVAPGDEAAFLAPLNVRSIWGIGVRTAERLQSIGIEKCGQLVAARIDVLRSVMGNQAESIQRRAQGIDNRPLTTDYGPPKSISQEWTFNRDVGDSAYLEDKLRQMCEKVSLSVRRKELKARTVTVKFRWSDFTTFTRQRSIPNAIDSTDEIFELAKAIWLKDWPPGKPMRLIGVGVSNLDSADTLTQLSFDF